MLGVRVFALVTPLEPHGWPIGCTWARIWVPAHSFVWVVRYDRGVAELADLMRSVADGGAPAADRALTVVAPPDARSVGVLSFAGHNVVSADLSDDWVRGVLPGDDLAAPLQAPFLTVLAGATGRVPDNLDLVLVAPATGRSNGMELTELSEFIEPLRPRLARALAQRIGVRAWQCPGGLLTLGRGVAGRWEVSVEVEPALRGFGLGRGLFTAARGLLPAGEQVWAQVAPGNAASVRAALAAGFQPVGAEVLLHQDYPTFGPFEWFVDLEPREADDGYEPNTVEQPGEPTQSAADFSSQVEGTMPPSGDDLVTNADTVPPLSVSSEQTVGDESVD